MQSWIQELRQLGPPNLVLAIAGNKLDISESRQVRELDTMKTRSCLHVHVTLKNDSENVLLMSLGCVESLS